MSDEPQAEEADTADSGIQDGDFVRLGYTLRTQEDDTVIDTTDPEIAAEAGLDDDDREFEPRVLVIGAGHLFPSVEDALLETTAGDSGTVEIPADDAFGEYDDDEVRTISANKIDEDNQYPGAQVQIDGEQGRIITIINTRARVDFNHPLAGQDLEYEYEVQEIVEDPETKAESLLGMYLQTPPTVRIETDTVEEEQSVELTDESETEAEAEAETEAETETGTETVEVEKETLYVDSTPEMQMNQQWLFSKQQIAEEVIDRIGIDRMIIQETLDGQGGMMGGLGGMMGGMGPELDAEDDLETDVGEPDDPDVEEAVEDLEDLEDVDIDAEELAAELGDIDE